jgi:O-antigen ligase
VFSGHRTRKTAVVAVSILVLLGTFYYTVVTRPVAFQTIASSGNISNRQSLWAVAANIAEDHPVAGAGAGNFTVVEPAYAVGNISLGRSDVVLEGELVHNTYLEVLAELGAVGLVAFLALVVGSLRYGVRAVRLFERRGDWEMELLSRGLVIGTVALLTAYFFATNLYEKQLWLLLGAGLALYSVARRQPLDQTSGR